MAAVEDANAFTEVLTEDVVFRMCHFLPGSALLAVGASCRSLVAATQRSAALWFALCRALLGETLVHLHARAWASAAPRAPWASSLAHFLQALFRAAYDCRSFAYAHALRQACIDAEPQAGRTAAWPVPQLSALAGLDPPRSGPAAERLSSPQELKLALAASGLSACTVGPFVVLTGGWRPYTRDPLLHVSIVDVRLPAVLRPRLAAGSARPSRRLRHSSCVVRPGGSGDTPQVLVLGGCHDETRAPCSGLQTLTLLELTDGGGEEVCWREEQAQGAAPQSLWHHACGSFANGKRVVVFGGDMRHDDPEFAHIEDRLGARHVYLLDVDRCCWERVQTSGDAPCWRSLHAGVAHTSLTDASERFVVMGGCEEHLALHAAGEPADMRGYSLNLSTFHWQCGSLPPVSTEDRSSEDDDLPAANLRQGHILRQSPFAIYRRTAGTGDAQGGLFLPEPRCRFAAERVGRHLVVYGGQPITPTFEPEDHLLGLNLITLEWSRIYPSNLEDSWHHAPAGALAGGVISGGVGPHQGGMVYLPVPKLEFLCLRPPDVQEEEWEDEDV